MTGEGRGHSPGLTGEVAGLGRRVAAWVPLPGLLHLPLVEEVAQPRAGIQAVPGEGRHPPALTPSPPWEPTWGGGCCQGWDPRGGLASLSHAWGLEVVFPPPPLQICSEGRIGSTCRSLPCSRQQGPGRGGIAAGVSICLSICPGGLCSPRRAGAPGLCPQQHPDPAPRACPGCHCPGRPLPWGPLPRARGKWEQSGRRKREARNAPPAWVQRDTSWGAPGTPPPPHHIYTVAIWGWGSVP